MQDTNAAWQRDRLGRIMEGLSLQRKLLLVGYAIYLYIPELLDGMSYELSRPIARMLEQYPVFQAPSSVAV